MAIVILKSPPQVAAAFNPMEFEVQTPKGRYAQLQKDLHNATSQEERDRIALEMSELENVKGQDTLDAVKVTAVVGDNAHNRTVTIVPTADAEGKATFDISGICRTSFVNERKTLPNGDGFIATDYNLVARWLLEYNNAGMDEMMIGYAVNAVQQWSEYDGQLYNPSFALLTRTPVVRYEGYPLSVTYAMPSTEYRLDIRKDNGSQLFTAADYPVTNVDLQNEDNAIASIKVNLKGVTLSSTTVQSGCVPDAPFYVRWINTGGGWNYRMFFIQEDSEEVSDIKNVQLVGRNQRDTQATINLTATRTVRVGAGCLRRSEFDILKALARSPRIEWYDEDLNGGDGGWQRIVLGEEFTAVWNNLSSLGEVQFLFRLPRILTQF